MVWILTAGREGFAWDIINLGRGRFFGYVAVWMQGWQLGQILGVTPCAALSFQHIPRAEYCPTGSCPGAWDEIPGCFTGQEGSVDPGLGWLLGGEEAALGTSRLLAWCCVCLWTPGCVPANPYNVGWVFECSRRGVSSRTVPFVGAEVMQNTEMYQRKKWGWKGPGGFWGLV